MAIIVEDLVKLLDGIGATCVAVATPTSAQARTIAAVLRKVADDLDA